MGCIANCFRLSGPAGRWAGQLVGRGRAEPCRRAIDLELHASPGGILRCPGFLAVAGTRRESPWQVASRLWLSPFKIGDVVLGLVVGIAGLLAYRSLQGVTGRSST